MRRRRAAILAAGQAEAEAMEKKAEAFAGYNEAAVLQMLIEVMPKVAAELARPMAGIDKLTVISTDGAGELPRQVSNNFVQTMELLKTTTGLDIESLIQKYARTSAATRALEAGAPAPRRTGRRSADRSVTTPLGRESYAEARPGGAA